MQDYIKHHITRAILRGGVEEGFLWWGCLQAWWPRVGTGVPAPVIV